MLNPTHGSELMVQILSGQAVNASLARNNSRIDASGVGRKDLNHPPTAVGGIPAIFLGVHL